MTVIIIKGVTTTVISFKAICESFTCHLGHPRMSHDVDRKKGVTTTVRWLVSLIDLSLSQNFFVWHCGNWVETIRLKKDYEGVSSILGIFKYIYVSLD